MSSDYWVFFLLCSYLGQEKRKGTGYEGGGIGDEEMGLQPSAAGQTLKNP